MAAGDGRASRHPSKRPASLRDAGLFKDKVRGVRTDWFHGIDRLGRVLIKAQTSAFDGQTEVSDQPERYRQ